MIKDPNNPCLFCNSKISVIAHENELAYESYTTYPVSTLPCLIQHSRHLSEYFDFPNTYLFACTSRLKLINNILSELFHHIHLKF